jgi:hypothetical protein
MNNYLIKHLFLVFRFQRMGDFSGEFLDVKLTQLPCGSYVFVRRHLHMVNGTKDLISTSSANHHPISLR